MTSWKFIFLCVETLIPAAVPKCHLLAIESYESDFWPEVFAFGKGEEKVRNS